MDAIPSSVNNLEMALNLQLNECRIRVVEGGIMAWQKLETTASHNLLVLHGVGAAAKLRCEVSMDTPTGLWPTL